MAAFSWIHPPRHLRSLGLSYRSWLGAPAAAGTAAPLTLGNAELGRSYRIAQLGAEPTFAASLMELGCLPGTRVAVLHRGRGALVLQVRGAKLILRQAQAQAIHLEGAAAPQRVPAPLPV